MKNLFYFIAATLFLASCTEDDLFERKDTSDAFLYAEISSDAASRISINDHALAWTMGDKFAAYDGTPAHQTIYLLESGAGTQQGKFKPVSSSNNAVQPTVAMYPVLEGTLAGNKLEVTLPDSYEANASQNAPMLGKISGNQVTFQHSMALVRINLTNLPAGFNNLKVYASQSIAGKFKIDNVNSSSVLTSGNKSEKVVTIKNISNGQDFYLPVPAQTISSMEFKAVKGIEERLVTAVGSNTFKAGYLYKLTRNGMEEANEFETLMNKVRELNPARYSVSNIKNKLGLFDTATGAFSDVNYNDRSRTNWDPFKHVDRLREFADAYTTPGNTYYQDKNIYDAIVKGLEYWYQKNPDSENWWNIQISEPKSLGLTLVRMRLGKEKISKDLETKTLNRMKAEGGDPATQTGANCTDIAQHWIYRACLTEDKATLEHALSAVFKSADINPIEGIQEDYSYFQHDQQIYFGGYGDEFLKGITLIALYANNTSYALQGQRLENLSNFMRKGFYMVIRGGYMPFGVVGRGVSRPAGTRKSGTASFARRMMEIDPANKAEFEKIAVRLETKNAGYEVKPSHTHFYRADYTVHVRPNYTFDVRMVSRCTMRCEYGNNENLKGYYIADGSTNILVDGNEYFDIYPYWKWDRVPGTTAPQNLSPFPMNKSAWGSPGNSYIVGGVSDGKYGASGMNYFDNYKSVNTGAHRSWYFFDDEIVCLGSVSATSSNQIKTTINQCHGANKAVTVGTATEVKTQGKNTTTYTNPKWVHHNKVGYVFPQGGKLWVNNVSQNGKWYDINQTKDKSVKTGDVFSLGFDYTVKPDKVPYAYIVLPAVTASAEVQKYADNNPITIVKNEYDIQSVYHNKLKIWQIAFLKDSNAEITFNGLTVKANRVAMVMIKETGIEGQYEVWAANIGRKDSKSMPLQLRISNGKGVERTINTGLSSMGNDAGKSKSFSLSF